MPNGDGAMPRPTPAAFVEALQKFFAVYPESNDDSPQAQQDFREARHVLHGIGVTAVMIVRDKNDRPIGKGIWQVQFQDGQWLKVTVEETEPLL